MCLKISEATAYLENAFDVLNEKLFDNTLTKKPVITIQSSKKFYGYFTFDKIWVEGDSQDRFNEINISADYLNRSCEEMIATLIHEMVHYYCNLKDIKDTSRNGRYHNKVFKLEAEKRLLHIEHDNKIGYSITTLTPELVSFVQDNGLVVDVGISRKTPVKASGKRPTSTRKYICPVCGMSVRATREVNILCIDCGEQLIVLE